MPGATSTVLPAKAPEKAYTPIIFTNKQTDAKSVSKCIQNNKGDFSKVYKLFGSQSSTFGSLNNFTATISSKGLPRSPTGLFTQNFNLLTKVEQLFNCSGICEDTTKRPLFYVTRDPATDGMPQRICLLPLHDYVRDSIKDFDICSHIIGFLCLALFCMHFTLYLRVYDPEWCNKEAWEHRRAALFGESAEHEAEHSCESHAG